MTDYESYFKEGEFEVLVTNADVALKCDDNYGVTAVTESGSQLPIQVGDRIIEIFNISVEKIDFLTQYKTILQLANNVVFMKFKRGSKDSQRMEIDNSSKDICASFFDIEWNTFTKSQMEKCKPNVDVSNIFAALFPKVGKWKANYKCIGGSGLGFQAGDSSSLYILIYKDYCFELTFVSAHPNLPVFRGKIRDGIEGHPNHHIWIYDIDDAGIGFEGFSWRGILVLERAPEAIAGKFPGDYVTGNMSLDSSAGKEHSFQVVISLVN